MSSLRPEREREEDSDHNKGSSVRGLGFAAAAMGVGLGVGAALYYFFNKQGEGQHASTSQDRSQQALARQNSSGSTSGSLDWDYNDDVESNFSSEYALRQDTTESEYTEFEMDEISLFGTSESSSSTASRDETTSDSSSLDVALNESDHQNAQTLTPEQEDMNVINAQIFRQRSWSLEECSICCEVMLPASSTADQLRMLPCGHKFHVKCVQPWTEEHDTCPNCRKGPLKMLKPKLN